MFKFYKELYLKIVCKKCTFRPGQKVPDLAPELYRGFFIINPLILHRTWSSCGNSRPCSRRRDTARRRCGRLGQIVLTWLSWSSTVAGSFSTVRFRYRYPYSAPHTFSFPCHERALIYVRQKCTVFFSVVDTKSLYPDPDTGPVPAFQVNPYSAPNHSLSLSREQATYVIPSKLLTSTGFSWIIFFYSIFLLCDPLWKKSTERVKSRSL